MNHLAESLRSRKCPNCGVVGRVGILLSEARFMCEACRSKDIDPFAIGPWDASKVVLDTKEGERVSFYVAANLETEEEKQLDEDGFWTEFHRRRFKNMGKRVVLERH